MKQTGLNKAIDEVIALKLKAVDEYVEEMTELLKDTNNPERLIGKKYEDWTPQDIQLLQMVYGQEPNPLTKLIFDKSYEEVKRLEEVV